MAVNAPPNGQILQNATVNAQVIRQLFAATIAASGGIVDAGGYAVTQNGTPNMSVNVAAGRAWIPGNQVGNISGFLFNTQGQYFALNDAVVNVAVAASNPTNPRIDLVVLQVLDAQYTGSTNLAQLAVITGTAAATPVAPAAPSNSLVLAQVAVAALATSIVNANLTDVRVYSAPLASQAAQGRKNALINAVGFPINQRGAATYSASGYTVDRWLFTLGTGAAGSIQQVAQTPGQNVAGYSPYQLNWNRSAAGTENSTLEQRIEGVSTFAGQTVTMSIVCGTGGGSVDFVPSLVQNFGIGGAPSASVTTTGPVLTATAAVQTLTATFAVPTISGKTLGTTLGADFLSALISRTFNSTNGATGTLVIFAIQVELGSAATALEVPPVAETQAECLRFYTRQLSVSTGDWVGAGVFNATTNVSVHWQWPTKMRAQPVCTSSGAGVLSALGSASFVGSANSFTGTNPWGTNINITVTGATAGQGAHGFLNAIGAWIDASAEL
jgi:hypothetical protein